MITAYAIWIVRLILWFLSSWYLPTILLLNLARFHRVARPSTFVSLYEYMESGNLIQERA